MRARKVVKPLVAALSLSLLIGISPAHALTLEKISAPYENLYRASGSTSAKVTSKTATPAGKHVGLLSKFNVNYVNVPVAEQTAVQAAIDIWSDNWNSSVPVNVVANFVPEGVSSGILASASPVSFFHNFTGAVSYTHLTLPTIYSV